MVKKILKLICLSLILMLILFESPIITNSQHKSEKCEKLFECYRTYYDECFEDALFDFSPRSIDKFGVINLEGEWASLDALASEFRNREEPQIFIVVYGGKINKKGELKERTDRLIYYLTGNRQIALENISVINGGFREKFEFEFWFSPSKKIFPPLTPTVDVEKVKFKGKMKPLERELGN